jgi:hypothetical protein
VATFVDFQAPDKEIVRTATLTDGIWAPPVDVSELAASSGKPSPAVAMSDDGTRVVVVFAQFKDATHQIQARVSTDSGATYGPVRPIAANVTEPEDISVAMSADGQRLVAVWTEEVSGEPEVRASVSTNGGGTWASAERLSASGRPAITPDLRISTTGTTAVAVWRERVSPTERQIHTRTLASGFWLPSQRLSPAGQDSAEPQLAGASDLSSAIAVWVNATLNEVQAARGIGESWSAPASVSEAGPLAQIPDIATGADGSRVTAVWRQSSNQILSSDSEDGGATWSRPISLSASAAGTDDPQIAAASSGFRFAAVWARPAGSDRRIQATSYFEAQPQTIAFTQPGTLTVGNSAQLAATASSGLPVTLTSGTPTTCSISGDQVRALAAGTCTITARQPGDVDFLPAADVTRTLTVQAAITPITPVARVQKITCAKTPPRKIKRRGTTVVLPKNCLTDAGQRVTVSVTGKRKDLRKIKVVRKAGKTAVKTFGTRVRLTVTYQAPGTSDVQALQQVRRYRT